MTDIGIGKKVLNTWSAALEVMLEFTPPMLLIVAATLIAGRVTATRSSRLSAMFLYATFGLFGLAIGFFMGAASGDENVVSTLLPVIITLVSGYVAFIAQKNADANFVRLLPAAMCIFLMSTVFTSRYMKTLPDPTIGTGNSDHSETETAGTEESQ